MCPRDRSLLSPFLKTSKHSVSPAFPAAPLRVSAGFAGPSRPAVSPSSKHLLLGPLHHSHPVPPHCRPSLPRAGACLFPRTPSMTRTRVQKVRRNGKETKAEPGPRGHGGLSGRVAFRVSPWLPLSCLLGDIRKLRSPWRKCGLVSRLPLRAILPQTPTSRASPQEAPTSRFLHPSPVGSFTSPCGRPPFLSFSSPGRRASLFIIKNSFTCFCRLKSCSASKAKFYPLTQCGSSCIQV